MRSIPLRPILIAVLAIALVLAVRAFACSGPKEPEASVSSSTPDPTFTDYVSENGQATLLGFFADASQGTSETEKVYVLVGLAAKNSSTTVDAYVGNSLIRFLSLDDASDYSDTTSTITASTFADAGFKTAAYAYDNTVKGIALSGAQTKLVATFDIDRATLDNAQEVSVWFDICSAVMNQTTSAIGYSNVILKFPREVLVQVSSEHDIVARYNK